MKTFHGPHHQRFHADKVRFQAAVGAAIRKHRHAAGMSQTQVAKAIGVSQTSVDNYEDGTSAPPSFVVWQLAHLFDCTADDLLVDPPEIEAAAE